MVITSNIQENFNPINIISRKENPQSPKKIKIKRRSKNVRKSQTIDSSLNPDSSMFNNSICQLNWSIFSIADDPNEGIKG